MTSSRRPARKPTFCWRAGHDTAGGRSRICCSFLRAAKQGMLSSTCRRGLALPIYAPPRRARRGLQCPANRPGGMNDTYPDGGCVSRLGAGVQVADDGAPELRDGVQRAAAHHFPRLLRIEPEHSAGSPELAELLDNPGRCFGVTD